MQRIFQQLKAEGSWKVVEWAEASTVETKGYHIDQSEIKA